MPPDETSSPGGGPLSRGRQGVAEERRQSLGTMAELPRESSSCEGRTVIEEDQFQEEEG